MISARFPFLKNVLLSGSAELKQNIFRPTAQSIYLRALCTSISTENDQKKPDENDILLEENKVLFEKYQRALAENENTRKRLQKQLEDMKSYAIQNFCKDLLEVSDNLDLALESAKMKTEGNLDFQSTSFYKGLQMTKDSLQKTFAKHGLVQIVPSGEVFDPEKHDALYEIPSESAKPGDVVEVLKSGYILNGRVIRPAKVAVAPLV